MDTLLVDLIYGAIGVASGLVISWAMEWFKTVPDNDEIEQMVRRMVQAAEQMKDASNEEKFSYVEDLLIAWLDSKGIKLSKDMITVFIESAVNWLKAQGK